MGACLICRVQQKFHAINPENSREELTCVNCGCIWRDRKLIFLVLKSINVDPKIYDKHLLDYSHRIIGVGDSFHVQSALGSKFNYVNTFINQFPRLNIEQVPDDFEKFDLVTCSDVLEHVLNLDKSIVGLAKLVKKGGIVVISAPMVNAGATLEHYPNIQNFKVNSFRSIDWWDAQGNVHQDFSAIFHGGDGNILEIRIISKEELQQKLVQNGFIIRPSHFFDEDLGIPQLDNEGFIVAEKT
jgi:SAM-dependent methyltransferase